MKNTDTYSLSLIENHNIIQKKGTTKKKGEITFVIHHNRNQQIVNFRLGGIGKISVNYGDGNSKELSLREDYCNLKPHQYSRAGIYRIIISGYLTKLTWIDFDNCNILSIAINSPMPNLRALSLYDNKLKHIKFGNFLPKLEYLDLNKNYLNKRTVKWIIYQMARSQLRGAGYLGITNQNNYADFSEVWKLKELERNGWSLE